MNSDLAYLSATEALARFRDRTLSPVELTQALIDRAAQVEPTVNALCVTRYDEALAEARAAEARYAGKDEPLRPLEGICIGIKDEMPIAGHPCSGGSLLAADYVATETDPMAERLLAAGAIAHARTTAPEFSCAAFTHTRLWGVTRNPWNPDFAVGGSSGGSGASLASGTSTLATGSDIGGSIRIPASANGVVGFKPPYGRVPQTAPWNLDQYSHNGPMARTIADCMLFENVIAGPHPRDPACVGPRYELPASLAGVEGMRIAYCVRPDGWPVDEEVDVNTRAAVTALADAGATVTEIEMPGWGPQRIWDIAGVHFGAIMTSAMAEATEHRELLNPYVLKLIDETATPSMNFYEGLVAESALHADLARIHADHDVLVWPTLASRGLVAGDDYLDAGRPVIGGVEPPHYFWSMMTLPFNICSRSPVLAVPSGVAANGVPTGIQIVGRPYDDVTPFRVGAALEQTLPWSDRRPFS